MPAQDRAERAEQARWAEIEGRKKRTVRFKVREVSGLEVLPTDPARYILEISKGNTAHLHALSEADLSALERVVGLSLRGEMPMEG